MRNSAEVTLREAIDSGRLRLASELPDDARTPPNRYFTLGDRRVCRGDETHAIRDADRSGQRCGRPATETAAATTIAPMMSASPRTSTTIPAMPSASVDKICDSAPLWSQSHQIVAAHIAQRLVHGVLHRASRHTEQRNHRLQRCAPGLRAPKFRDEHRYRRIRGEQFLGPCLDA